MCWKKGIQENMRNNSLGFMFIAFFDKNMEKIM